MRALTDRIELVQPGRVNFGAGVLLTCRAVLDTFGARRVLVLHEAVIAGGLEPLFADFRSAGLEFTARTGVPPEPDVEIFEKFRREADALEIDAVVGIGGGSVLDVAKLLAGVRGLSAPVGAYFGQNLLPARKVKLICLPTTAGTGSEASPNAILYDAADSLKKAVISPHLVPDAAIIDPVLTLSVPRSVTAATGVDALVHCIEAYANLAAHPVIDRLALEGARLISSHLERAVRDGSDLEARTAVALGSFYGGLCLGPVNTAAVHALAYPLGSEFRLAHGLSNALLLTSVLRFNLSAAPDRYADVARAIGVNGSGTAMETAEAGLERLDALVDACGVPSGLSHVGVTERDIPRLAAAALRVTRLLRNNPRPLTQADAESIYRQAL